MINIRIIITMPIISENGTMIMNKDQDHCSNRALGSEVRTKVWNRILESYIRIRTTHQRETLSGQNVHPENCPRLGMTLHFKISRLCQLADG